jgi:thioredoxin-related protein
MDRINAQKSDTVVMFVDIKEWESPVASQYNIRSVPSFKIYDSSGVLITEGSREGGAWIQQNHPEVFR